MMIAQPQGTPLTAQSLFERVFWPIYPPDVRAELLANRPAPISRFQDGLVLELIEEIGETFRRIAPSVLGLPEDVFDDSDASVHMLGAALTRERRDSLLVDHSMGELRIPLLGMIAIHGTIYVGHCAVRNHGGSWTVRNPLWESTVKLRSTLGEADLAVFQWWLKSLSDEEVDRLPLGDRYRTYVEVPCFQADTLPVLSHDARPIPRIALPQRNDLIAHLAQHAPGVQDIGVDFPTAERLAEMRFEWLDFQWVGDGRMLLMHGPALHQGTHLFWLGRHGFIKSAFYPSDNIPPHAIRVQGDKLRVIVSVENVVRFHDIPWWGP